jgi:ATP-dependent HslUV protease ATP-binding subunit HslU
VTLELTPRQIVAELDRYIVGQAAAKRAVAVALRNRYRRSRLDGDLKDEVIPKNILMIGPTGVGKTEIARRLARLAGAPFLKVEATKFTEVGYVGRDVDSIVRDLVQVSLRLVEAERTDAVKEQADRLAVEKIVDILRPPKNRVAQATHDATRTAQDQFAEFQQQMARLFGQPSSGGTATVPPPAPEPPEDTERDGRIRERLRQQIAAGTRDGETIEIEIDDSGGGPAFLPMMPGGDAQQSGDLSEMLRDMMPRRRKKRTVSIGEARVLLAADAARSLIDRDDLTREAIARAEQSGIVFLDEIDKIAVPGGPGGRAGGGPDVSRQGVQRDLLPLIEGSTVHTKWGSVRTNHVLFIAAGAFHVSKPSDLIPELQGRLPIRVELDSLNEDDFRRILTEPKSALTRQYAALLAADGVTVRFEDSGIRALARIAVEVNARMEDIGARRLHTVVERLLEEISFDAPETERRELIVDGPFVQERLAEVASDDDLSRYIL